MYIYVILHLPVRKLLVGVTVNSHKPDLHISNTVQGPVLDANTHTHTHTPATNEIYLINLQTITDGNLIAFNEHGSHNICCNLF